MIETYFNNLMQEVERKMGIESSLSLIHISCGQKLGKGDADYIGPTRAAISIIYMLSLIHI